MHGLQKKKDANCFFLVSFLYLLRYTNPPRQLDSHESLGSPEHESPQWTLWKWDFLEENKDRKPKKRMEDRELALKFSSYDLSHPCSHQKAPQLEIEFKCTNSVKSVKDKMEVVGNAIKVLHCEYKHDTQPWLLKVAGAIF